MGSEIRGLGIRLKPSGTKTFFVQYRNEARRTRRLVLGQFGVLSVEQARELAPERLVAVIKGKDPSAERKAMHGSCTVQQLCHWYLKEAESGRLLGRRRRPIKASSLIMDRSRIRTHIVPLLGTMLVSGLKRGDIERMQLISFPVKRQSPVSVVAATQQVDPARPVGQYRHFTPSSSMGCVGD